METKTCKYCKKEKSIKEFVKVLSWRRKCCVTCYDLPFLEKQREKDRIAIQKRLEYEEFYEKNCRKRYPVETDLYQGAKARAKRFGCEFNLKKSDIIVPEFCPVLGIKLRRAKNRMDDYSPTIDRLDPSKGYIKENICIMSNRANRIKSNGSIEEHEKILVFMKNKGLTNIKSVV